jgi:hypothetical protein
MRINTHVFIISQFWNHRMGWIYPGTTGKAQVILVSVTLATTDLRFQGIEDIIPQVSWGNCK